MNGRIVDASFGHGRSALSTHEVTISKSASSGPHTPAPLLGREARVWLLTDGKAGDLAQLEGVAECLGVTPEIRVVRPRAPWSWLAPWGPIDRAEAPRRSEGPIAPPFPDILIASGRRTVPYLRHVRRASARTFTVFLKDPRTGPGTSDMIWVPEHDRLRADNVIVTLTSPHRIRQAAIAATRQSPPAAIAELPSPRVAVFLGGPSAVYRYRPETVADLAERLRQAASEAGSFLVTPSRRTPPALLDAARQAIAGTPSLVWDGEGRNPYAEFLALGDFIIVPGDSTNMVSEALASGRPVLVYRPPGRAGRVETFLGTLAQRGMTRDFSGVLESYASEPIDSTPHIAAAIAMGYRAWQAPRCTSGGRHGVKQ